MFSDLPPAAAWRHGDSRTGFEVVSFSRVGGGWSAAGCTTAIEGGAAWWVEYDIELDASFVTRRATIAARIGPNPVSSILVEADGSGSWLVDGHPAPQLSGCLDVDLESSAMTNALPMRRMSLEVGDAARAPAVYVRVRGLNVERLEQHYLRRPNEGPGTSYDYEAAAFEFACRIDYDQSGLVVTYPGIAERAA